MDRDRFRNISNLDLVEPKRTRDSIYAYIRLLCQLFETENVAHMHLQFDDVSPSASSNVHYFLSCG